jgi:hypothetical protein
MMTIACQTCELPFRPRRSTARYCSDRCRKAMLDGVRIVPHRLLARGECLRLCSRDKLRQLPPRVEHARLHSGFLDANYLGNFRDRLAVIVHEVDDLAVLRRQAIY